MSKITKPNFADVWSSAGSKTAPSSLKIQTGWVGEKPPYEYWNYMMNRSDVASAYSFQMGVPEWDSAVEYQYHANYKSYVQRAGLVYKALQVGTNKDPATEAAYWALAFDNYGSAATVQTNLNTHITDYGTLASLSNVATARTNLDVYSKGEGDARYAALAGISTQLFSVANGTTGFEAVNKSQLDTKAALAGSSGQEFAVATATTGNSAINKTQFETKTSLATDSQAGIVEKALLAELVAATADKYPDAALLLTGFSITASRKGHIKLPDFLGGLIIQWELEASYQDINPATPSTFSYDIAFAAAPYIAVATFVGDSTSGSVQTMTAGVYDVTNTGLKVRPDEWFGNVQNCKLGYIAIGK